MPNDFVSVIQPKAAKAGESTGESQADLRPIPVLPVRDTVLFPHAVLPLTVGRESSIQLIQSLGEEKTILVVAQRDARQDSPEASDLHAIGTKATVHKVVKMPNQSLFVFTEGNERVRLGTFTQISPFMVAEAETIAEIEPVESPETEALQRNVVSQFPTDCYVVADPFGRSADNRYQYRRAWAAGGLYRFIAAFSDDDR